MSSWQIIRARPMLATALVAAIFQLCWPAALALHGYLDHSPVAVADLHDLPDDSDPSHHSHDHSSDCQTCQSIALLRTVDLPAPVSTIRFTQAGQTSVASTPQSILIAVSLTSAAPRAPPAA